MVVVELFGELQWVTRICGKGLVGTAFEFWGSGLVTPITFRQYPGWALLLSCGAWEVGSPGEGLACLVGLCPAILKWLITGELGLARGRQAGARMDSWLAFLGYNCLCLIQLRNLIKLPLFIPTSV